MSLYEELRQIENAKGCIDRNDKIQEHELNNREWNSLKRYANGNKITLCEEIEPGLLSKFESNPLGYFATQSPLGPARMNELAKTSIAKMAKEEEAEKLASILETIWPENHLSYHDIVTSINQGETKDMEKCVGPVKTHPRICSFLMHRDFEFRPIPISNTLKQYEMPFKDFLQRNNNCFKGKDYFELCKENFCQFIDCTGKTLPDYEDFYDEL